MFRPGPFLGQVALRPPQLGCGMMYIPAPSEQDREEESRMMGCAEHGGRYIAGCSKCRRKKRKDWTLEARVPSDMMGATIIEQHGILAGHRLSQGAVCSVKPPVISPDTNCQRTESGDIICSNGVIYSGTCPNAPAVNYPGVAPNMPGTTIPQAPPYKSAEQAGGAAAPEAGGPPSSSLPVIGIVAGGAAVVGIAFLLFSK